MTKIFKAIAIVPAILAIIIIRLLKPVVLIRFSPLYSSRIGHFAINTELYLCERDIDDRMQKTVDLFYHSCFVCNQQLKKMWDRVLHVSPLIALLDRANKFVPGYKSHIVPISESRDYNGLLRRVKPHLYFFPKEERFGRAQLAKLGMPDGAMFVCFHSRSFAYLNSVNSNQDWHYHDYRNTRIDDYIPAMQEVVNRGYFAVRTGAIVEHPLNTGNPWIIDYAVIARTDFMDIFLSAKCRFFVVDTAGIYALPLVFRRPVVSVNIIPFKHAPLCSENRLFIPKKLWLLNEKRFMTFREILESEIGGFYKTEQYKSQGIDIVDNTPEEITALVVEMDKRINGSWETSDEDEKLQERFQSLFTTERLEEGFSLSRIGMEFLRQNRNLL